MSLCLSLAGLSAVEIGRLNPTVMSFIQPSTIPLIPVDCLNVSSLFDQFFWFGFNHI